MEFSKISPLRFDPLARAFDAGCLRLKHLLRARSGRKKLAVRESAGLGERRFVSVVQYERQRFLIGSSPGSVTLLTQLPDEDPKGGAA